MTIFDVLLSVLIAVVTGLIFYYVFKISGPWGSLWTFLLILILAGITAALWIRPVGPVYYEFAWLPTLFVVVLIVILLGAVSYTRKGYERPESTKTGEEEKGSHILKLSAYFWFFVLLMLTAIIIGVII